MRFLGIRWHPCVKPKWRRFGKISFRHSLFRLRPDVLRISSSASRTAFVAVTVILFFSTIFVAIVVPFPARRNEVFISHHDEEVPIVLSDDAVLRIADITPTTTKSVVRLQSPGVRFPGFRRLHEPVGDFCDESVLLVILVASAVDNVIARNAIRRTWGLDRRSWQAVSANYEDESVLPSVMSRVKVVHMLGLHPDEDGFGLHQSAVNREASDFGDVLQESFLDSYANLTLKTVMGMKWISEQRCFAGNKRGSTSITSRVPFVMKTDDDVFVNLPALIPYLDRVRASGTTRWITGCNKRIGSLQPIPAGNYSLPRAHPDFVAGAGYVISGDLVSELTEVAETEKLIPVEDVFLTGRCASRLSPAPTLAHDARFSCGQYVADARRVRGYFTVHLVPPKRQFYLWERANAGWRNPTRKS